MVVDEVQWSGELFGHCDLGDVRRTRRLVDVAARLARNAGQSLARCCQGDTAAVLGSYRLIENASVGAEAIAEAGFEAMAQAAQTTSGVLLAVEDSTSVVYTHAVTDQLGTTGSQQQPKHRGYLVHSVLLLEASSERTLGLVEQRRWCREDAGYGRKHARKRRAYEDKESYKWQQASERMAGRMGSAMARTISVCDRESDVYEYLRYKHEQAQRYVIRAQSDRGLTQGEQTLFGALAGEQAWQYEATVDISQRGGRAARKARVQVCGRRVEVKPPADRGKQAESLPINVVLVREPAGDESHEPLNWVLLTSEPVQTVEHVKRIVRYYELRWRIEEYHKVWKSGVGVERLRQQSPANLERMLAITAFVAVRLLQLREQLPSRPNKDASQAGLTCDHILETEEWKVLWLTVQKTPLPATPPTARWACLALARLGGFTDTKRTGRPGWATLWHGWQALQERVAGFRLATGMATEM
jgi:hypothetical protein